MKKLCIFDFDGTMFDSLEDVVKCFNLTLDKLGYEKQDLEFYKKSLGGNINEIIGLILKDKNNEENIGLVKKTFAEIYYNDTKKNTHMYNGIHELLEKLQEENIVLAINSNRNVDSIKRFLKQYSDDIDFIEIQGQTSSTTPKPDPYGVNVILEKSGIAREDTVYIGDSATDIATAQNARIDCILVTWGYGVGDVYEDKYPLAIVDNPQDIYKIVKKE